MKYLREESYYQDLYNKRTVHNCRLTEKAASSVPPEKVGKMLVTSNIGNFILQFEMLRLGAKRREVVEEWMAKDRKRDEFFERTPVPKVQCERCGKTSPEYRDKTLETGFGKKPDRILFYFKCGSCGGVTTAYDNGEILPNKIPECPKCRHELVSSPYVKKSEHVYESKNTCVACGYESIERMDLTPTPRTEEPDTEFETDRARFCLSYEEAKRRYDEWIRNLDEMKRVLDEINGKKENKPVYDALEKVRRLKIKPLEKYLSEELAKLGYSDFRLSKPVVEKDVRVYFTMVECADGGSQYSSVKNAKARLEDLLIDTNWVLMSEGSDCRLGIIRGRLRGIDDEQELLKLTERRLKNAAKAALKKSSKRN